MRQRFDKALSSRGVPFRENPGWSTRGSANYKPEGVVLHHTAGSQRGGDTASLSVVVNGRPGIPGPLCNIYIDRKGVVHLVAAGRANHAGKNSSIALAEMRDGKVGPTTKTAAARKLKDDVTGNTSTIGIEIENDGLNEPWSEALIDSTARTVAALCQSFGWSIGHVTQHKLLTSRKSDTSFTGDWWARAAAHFTRGPGLSADDLADPTVDGSSNDVDEGLDGCEGHNGEDSNA